MSLQACADLLRDHDPDRFGAMLAAAPDDRPRLITLYALNLELARAPFQSAEPMLAQMRLQWWIDRLSEMGQGIEPPLHDVLTPLWQAWGPDAATLAPLAEARIRDCAREPFADAEAVLAYVDATAGGLMWSAATALGAGEAAHEVVGAQGRGAGAVAWLRALPELRQLGMGFALERPEQVTELARAGIDAFKRASTSRRQIMRRAAPALFAGPAPLVFLNEVAGKGLVDPETIAISPFRRRAALARLALTGRWWV